MEQVIKAGGAYPIVEVGSIETVRDIFGLYARLSGPLKEMEQVCDRQEALEKEVKEARETVSTAFIRPFISAFVWTFCLAIPFIILFLIITNVVHASDGQALFDVYDQWLSETTLGAKFLGMLPKGGFLGLVSIVLSLVLWGGLFPCIIFLLPAMFALSVIATIFSVIFAKRVIKKNTAVIPLLQQEIDDRIRAMAEALSYVPPDYRFSMAINHFVQSYANQKADSLKEAVNLFDVYMHQQKMEQKQQEILDMERRKLSEMAYQSEQLDKINRNIKQIKHDVDWMSW